MNIWILVTTWKSLFGGGQDVLVYLYTGIYQYLYFEGCPRTIWKGPHRVRADAERMWMDFCGCGADMDL